MFNQISGRLMPSSGVRALILSLWLLAIGHLADVREASAQSIDQIRERSAIRLGVRNDAAPFSYISEASRPSGYSVDLCIAVVGHLTQLIGVSPIEINFVEVSAEDRFEAVASGRVDILCGATSITLTRREEISFSTPIFVDGASVLLRRDGPQSFQELDGKIIGVRGSTTTEDALENTLIRQNVSATVLSVVDHDDGLAALEAGKIDAYFADQSILLFLMGRSANRDEFTVANNTFTLEVYGLGLRRGDENLRLAVDRSIARVLRSGDINRIIEKNFAGAKLSEGVRYLLRFGALPE